MVKLNITKWQRNLNILHSISCERHFMNTYYSYKMYSYSERFFQDSIQAFFYYRLLFSYSFVQSGERWRRKAAMFQPKLFYYRRNLSAMCEILVLSFWPVADAPTPTQPWQRADKSPEKSNKDLAKPHKNFSPRSLLCPQGGGQDVRILVKRWRRRGLWPMGGVYDHRSDSNWA